jgi:hypothetical protein
VRIAPAEGRDTRAILVMRLNLADDVKGHRVAKGVLSCEGG